MIIGVDIGGTKCAIGAATPDGGVREIARFATADVESTLGRIEAVIDELAPASTARIGIACGGPLDARAGLILSPPNLPGWDHVPVAGRFRRRWGCAVALMNDANANALAEWRFGAGRGSRLMLYLTAGTGMGAGIVIDGRMLEGVCGNAGEVGHLRLAAQGPVGHHKAGSFEGFCSGGGIPTVVDFIPPELRPKDIAAWRRLHPTTEAIAGAAAAGEPVARAVFSEVGRRFGAALAVLVDLFNPDRIVLGSLYVRCGALFDAEMRTVLAREALADSMAACTLVPAALGEQTGMYGAVCAAPAAPLPGRPASLP
jgi:glucokinase